MKIATNAVENSTEHFFSYNSLQTKYDLIVKF
jgi:hypothetical protein